jgi:hypothetical protein
MLLSEMTMISNNRDSAFKICDEAENGMENKDAESSDEDEEKTSVPIYREAVADFKTVMMICAHAKWFKFISYRGNCCSVAQQRILSCIIVKIIFQVFAFAVVLYIAHTMLTGYLIV